MSDSLDKELGKKKISRERRKELKNKLKAELGEKKKLVFKTAFLSWLQFLMRIISFGIIAKGFSNLYFSISFSPFLYALAIVLLNILGFVISLTAKKYQGIASQFARDSLKKKFFNAFSKNSEDFSKKFSYADVLTVASQGIDSLDTFYNLYLSTTLRTYFNCATILFIVLFIYPVGSLIFILSIPFIPVSIILIQKRSAKIMKHYWETYMDVGNLFMDDLKSLNTLYSYSADEIYEKNFNDRAEDFRLSTMELLKFQLQSVGYMDGVMYLGIGISGFFATLSVFNGNLSIFKFIFFILIATEFFTPVRELGYCMHLLMMNTKMADRIFGFLDSVNLDESQEFFKGIERSIEKIEFKNVDFSYGERKILDNLSFSVSSGNLFAIAGESGLGKSTIAKILFKQIENFDGEILIDGKSLKDLSKQEMASYSFYISPDSYLFNESILENLKKATNMSEAEILNWISEKNILNFVSKLPKGFDTVVGENGNLISPGQRQQIIYARALLANRSIYIFDEMTSSVDAENEDDILNLIRMISKDRIVIFISHKMKQVNRADAVLFMGRKELVFGTPSELLNSCEEYKILLNTQNEMEAILNGK